MMNTYVIATPPLPLRVRRDMGLGTGDAVGHGAAVSLRALDARSAPCCSAARIGRSCRARRARMPSIGARSCSRRNSRTSIRRSTGVTPDYAWEGLFATTPDGLPYIGAHRRYPRQLFALGYGGNGMTFGYLAAEVLVRAVRGARAPDDELFGFGRRVNG